ncbi:MAG: N-acetylmuramoyl-L-alanine amidase family protein [Tannerellaceae bacterium]
MKRDSFKYLRLILISTLCFISFTSKAGNFVVVIDPGHGGKDPGARGTSALEKTINLSVSLKLGELIESNHRDVKVVYTRKTDRFIELDERANIANRNKADLFISIHTNALKNKTVSGTETYTLGLGAGRTDENLEIAMRENSAILLEDNYEQKYEGFNPNSSESYIIFEFMQNKFMEQSIEFASHIQKGFARKNRTNRGVRQAGFLVLRKTTMPSVLVELGYISNRNEEQYLKSSSGQSELAHAIYTAFDKHKREHDRKAGSAQSTNRSDAPNTTRPNTQTSSRKVTSTNTTQPTRTAKAQSTKTKIYKVQILTSNRKLPKGSSMLKGYSNVDFYVEKNIYKYTYGSTESYNEILNLWRKVRKDFKDAFIITFDAN